MSFLKLFFFLLVQLFVALCCIEGARSLGASRCDRRDVRVPLATSECRRASPSSSPGCPPSWAVVNGREGCGACVSGAGR